MFQENFSTMSPIHIYPITSPIHNAAQIEQSTKLLLAPLQASGMEIILTEDFSTYGRHNLQIIYVRTGGTEGIFKSLAEQYENITSCPIYLLASEESNSLAASVEILSWLEAKGYKGEIIHGNSNYIINKIKSLYTIVKAKNRLKRQRAGIIGKPSDWLISSTADYAAVRERLDIELVDIEIKELIEEYDKTKNYNAKIPEQLQPCNSRYFEGAIGIFNALQNLISRHNLSALTLRCFDLLDTIHNTGCLSLALLNSHGTPAACEGDVPALLTMMISEALFGQTGFQANPSRINPLTGEITFAHCTVPLNMISRYNYDTHFESGIGVAIHGELPEEDATIVKVQGSLNKWFCEDVTLLHNSYEKQLCRTQVILQTQSAAEYLLHHPIGNHHIILTGHHKATFDEFMRSL